MLFTYFALLIFLKIESSWMFTVKIFNFKTIKNNLMQDLSEKYESIDLETPLFLKKSYPLG